jgi:predicted nucleotidyltransferase
VGLHDPYRAAIEALNRQGVRYVVVGMSGINYYANNPAETFATLDYDIFLEPTLHNVEKALRGLTGLGFTVGTVHGVLSADHLTRLVRDRRTFVATTPDGVVVELLLKVSGHAFSDLAKDAATFVVGGIPVKVGRLTKLLKSKQLAGRPKDLQFLRRYRALVETDPPSSKKPAS